MSTLGRARIVIVGAGILGLATAATLAGRGANVVIVDPDAGAGSASAAAAGMISPALEAALEDATPERAGLYREAAALWPDFAREHGLDLVEDGADWRGPAEPLATRLRSLGFPLESHPSHLHVPGEARVDVADALSKLKNSGAVIVRERCRRIETGPIVVTDGQRIGADAVVLAAGWSAAQIDVEEAPGLAEVIRPVKGQILALAGAGTDQVRRIVRGVECYLLPGREGILVGATMEPDRIDTAVEPKAVDSLRTAAVSLEPALRKATVVRAWAGVRGATPDGLPMVGKTRAGGVFAALGPRRNGWLFAPLAGRLVAAAIAGEATPDNARAFRPGRFDPA